MVTALLILAQGAQHTQEAPDEGPGILLIVGTIVVVALLLAGVFAFFTRASRASRGGVEEPPRSRERGAPPFEGVERDA
jgi:heme/copper-type cytochrome/quinol oxidase subunit 2